MAATLFGEAVVSRSRSGGVVDLIYILHGTDDDTEVRDAVLVGSSAIAPTTYDGLQRQDSEIQIDPLVVDSAAGSGWWTVRVPYSVAEWGFNIGTDSYTFDTSGGTQHITHSRNVAAKYPDAAPDIGGANGGPIGATADGVAGVDWPVGQYEWEETHIFSWADINDAYKDAVALLTGRVNDATFRNCDAGEALFLGARGGKLPDETAAITFRFAKSPNATDLNVGEITGIDKEGWQYLDVIYEPKELGADPNQIVIQQPKFVYVHDIAFRGDFSTLGI
jgi:hypothetical protein